jgi:hypothetical protein
MPFAWVLNQDAELEMARSGYTPSAQLLAQLAQHGAAAETLLGPDDVLVEHGRHLGSQFVGRAWCPTPLALAKLRAVGVQPEPHPTAEVLRRVNHRKFAFELGGGLHDQHYVTTLDQAQALVGTPQTWMCKRPLAFAGRGQLRVNASLDEKQQQWVDASLRSDGFIMEPLVTPLLEVSLHGFVWRDLRFELGRVCVQNVSERGVYRGVRLAQEHELDAFERSLFFASAQKVAHALGTAGYFGPFGIDGYRYADEGRTGFCPLSEINARYTMAFVTGFSRHPSTITLP